MSTRHAGTRFARYLKNIAQLGFEGVLKILSIRLDLIEFDTNRLPRYPFVIPEVDLCEAQKI